MMEGDQVQMQAHGTPARAWKEIIFYEKPNVLRRFTDG
jgi:hypothetical protein